MPVINPPRRATRFHDVSPIRPSLSNNCMEFLVTFFQPFYIRLEDELVVLSMNDHTKIRPRDEEGAL